ncbi:aminotransferase class I/II-fold pyridoxal phosphate-dependent enzyme [Kitasatospora sp. NBC_01539]|uniref:aminotransferase class I/II-fold pyridoxal phosphate-dependent enzyme n=1 Tax=Kitasatospora sp. NBC_01539 TaxID=2903577 RepID=UPI0038600AD8
MPEEHRIRGRRAADIAADVERAVADGSLAPGSALPPLRDLATELAVNPNTVAAAYRLLRDRGVIETAGRRGSRVLPRPSHTPREQRHIEVPAGARDLADGNPDPALLPPLEEALAYAAAEQRRDPVLYARATVDERLLALARADFEADGLPAGSVAVLSGSLDAIERVLLARLRPGDSVAVEDPGWGSLLDLLAALGLRTVAVRVDDEGPTVADTARALAGGAAALVVTSSAQNPTGAAVSARRAAELRAVLAGHPGVLLVEDDFGHAIADEPYQLLCVDGAGRPVVDSWVLVRSVTKLLGPDLRLALVTGDTATVDRVRGRQRLGAGWVSHVLQRAVAQLWSGGAASRERAAAHYALRRGALVSALAGLGVPAHGRSGFNVWVPVHDETAAVVGLLQRGWVVTAGARFRIASGPGIRITVSRLSEEEIPRLALDIAAVLRTDLDAARGG